MDTGHCLIDTDLINTTEIRFQTGDCDGTDISQYWTLPPTGSANHGFMVNAQTGQCLGVEGFTDCNTTPADNISKQGWQYDSSSGEITHEYYPNDVSDVKWMTGRALSPRPLIGAGRARHNPILVGGDNNLLLDSGTIHNWHVPQAGYYGFIATTDASREEEDDPQGTLLCADHVHDSGLAGNDIHAVRLIEDNPCINADSNDKLIWRGHAEAHGSQESWFTEYSNGRNESNNHRMFNFFSTQVSYSDATSGDGLNYFEIEPNSASWYQWYKDAPAMTRLLAEDFSDPEVYLIEDFDDGNINGWTIFDDASGTSNWSVSWDQTFFSSGNLLQTSNIYGGSTSRAPLPKPGTYLIYDDGDNWQDYVAELYFLSTDNDAIGLMFRYQDDDNYYRFSWDQQRNYRRLVKKVDGNFTLLAEDSVPYIKNKVYKLGVSAEGDRLRVSIDGVKIFDVNDTDISSGSTALYAWANSTSLFDGIKVSDATLPGWTIVDEGNVSAPSNWVHRNGELLQTSNIHGGSTSGVPVPKPGTYLILDDGYDLQNYETRLNIRSTDNDTIGLMFRYQDNDNYYRFSWDQSRNRQLVKKVNGDFTILVQDSMDYVQGDTHALVVSAEGAQLSVNIDGETIFSVEDTDISSGTLALYCWGNQNCHYDNLEVVGSSTSDNALVTGGSCNSNNSRATAEYYPYGPRGLRRSLCPGGTDWYNVQMYSNCDYSIYYTDSDESLVLSVYDGYNNLLGWTSDSGTSLRGSIRTGPLYVSVTGDYDHDVSYTINAYCD